MDQIADKSRTREEERLRRLEALAEKLARRLEPGAWQALFDGPELETIHFEQKIQSVLYAEAGAQRMWTRGERDAFDAEVEWLAVRHNGLVDRYVDGAAAVFFDDAGACVRMAMDLQRSASDLQLRMGIHTGICEIGTFRSGFQKGCTLIGHETGLAAKVAAAAATGSIAMSPETYARVKDDVQGTSGACLVMEEFDDTDLAQVCLTPTPAAGELSTFAGLGLT